MYKVNAVYYIQEYNFIRNRNWNTKYAKIWLYDKQRNIEKVLEVIV